MSDIWRVGTEDVLTPEIGTEEPASPAEDSAQEAQLTARFDRELALVRQPVVDLQSGEASHHELLLRVRGRRGRLESPGSFLAGLKREGHSAVLDRWVVARAVRLIDSRAHGPQLEVNLSTDSALNSEFSEYVSELLAVQGASAGALIIETDDNRVDGMKMAHFSRRLFKLGHHFTLEQFERSGLNALSRLRTLPFDLIKIDGEFIRELPSSPDDQAIVRRITTIVSNVGRKTVAMHVQDEETLEILKEIGVDLGQGYHLGLPERVSDS